jgi:hypothetical protein
LAQFGLRFNVETATSIPAVFNTSPIPIFSLPETVTFVLRTFSIVCKRSSNPRRLDIHFFIVFFWVSKLVCKRYKPTSANRLRLVFSDHTKYTHFHLQLLMVRTISILQIRNRLLRFSGFCSHTYSGRPLDFARSLGFFTTG